MVVVLAPFFFVHPAWADTCRAFPFTGSFIFVLELFSRPCEIGWNAMEMSEGTEESKVDGWMESSRFARRERRYAE